LEHEPKNDLARFAPSILLSHRTPTISFNVSAFDETSTHDMEIENDLRRLDAELEALALEPDDDGNVDDPDESESEEGSPEAHDVD
jgi:hypothetical protein